MKEAVDKIAYDLNGTCKSLHQVLEENDMLALEDHQGFLAMLDDEVFECTRCGWWHEQSQMADDCGDEWICQECADDE